MALPNLGFQVSSHQHPDDACLAVAASYEQRVHEALISQGQLGLLPSQKGRCRNKEPQKLRAHSKPLKPSRSGHVTPLFQGHNLQHQRQFTQLRRLESLRRLFNVSSWNTNQLVHAQREWRAVHRAQGFGHFPTWWSSVPEKFANAPEALPTELPTAEELSSICLVVEREVRRNEKLLQAELVAKAKLNRATNPNKIFRDFAKAKAAPVSVLVDYSEASIVEVDHEQQALLLDRQHEFGSGDIIAPHGSFKPIIMCDDMIWVDDVSGFAPGQKLRQEHFVGQLEELFSRFSEEWQQRWDKHKDIPDQHWQPLTEFFDSAQPAGPLQAYVPITIQQWKKAVAKKKPSAAQGPDGWTRQDLLHLPDDLTQAILDLITRVECGQAQWPQQWLCGIVHSLEKHEGATSVSSYRPITIFSLIYRTWASIRAKEMLLHLLPQMPGECFGNLPARCTTNLWMALQATMEDNHANGQHSCGAVLDIVKCFNYLPRTPILQALRRLGAAPQIIQAWNAALHNIERRFAIRGSVSHAVRSSTGFAEGCSLSIIAMLATNQLMDVWLQRKTPLVRMLTYVDNIELLANDPHGLMQGVTQLKRILQLMDLTVDDSKTYLWSPNGQFRTVFLQHGHNIRKAARDVGAHLQYTRQATNYTITAKIDAFKERWKSLAISPAPYQQKLLAVRAVAWPCTLHGITSAHVGDSWYEELRTGAMRALKEHKKGCSPLIHLSLIEHPSFDPGFHALSTTVMQCRQYMSFDQCAPHFARLSENTQRVRPEVGPSAVVLHRLSAIFWTWDTVGFFRDAFRQPIDLWHAPIQELQNRLVEAWQYKIACEVSSRKTFEGMHTTNARLTMESDTKQPRDRAIMRSALNGTFFTANHLRHQADPADTGCKLCGQPDSLFHRNWECKALTKCRAHLSEDEKRDLLAMPPATHLQGWMPDPAELQTFRQLLDNLPEPLHFMDIRLPNQHEGPVHFFTDGACRRPQDRLARLCSWAVVFADPSDLWTFHAAAAGPLKGRFQTVLRAEIVAVTVAAHIAMRTGSAFCLWTDNKRVLQLLQQMIAEPQRTWSNKACNHDVINDLAAVMRMVAHLCQGVFKVASHQKSSPATPTAEKWCFAGNEAADHAADMAFAMRPEVVNSWTTLCQQLDSIRHLRNGLHLMLEQIGTECLLKHPDTYVRQTHPARAQTAQLVMTDWRFPVELPPEAAPYAIPECKDILTWIDTLHNDEQPVQRWSWWHLYIDATFHVPSFGPWYHVNAKKWKGGSTQPPEPFLRRARWFAQFLTKLAKSCNLKLPTKHTSTAGSHITFWTTTVPVKVSQDRTTAIDRWLQGYLPCACKTADLRKVDG